MNVFLGLVLTARHGMEGGNTGKSSGNKGAHGRITNWAKVELKCQNTR